MLVTFFTFLIIIWRLIKNPLNNFLHLRSEKIKDSILKNKQLRDDALQKFQIHNQRLINLDSEIQNIKNNFTKQGEYEFQKLKQETEKVLNLSLRELEFKLKTDIFNFEMRLRHEIAGEVIKKAKNILSHNEQINTKFQNQVIEDISK